MANFNINENPQGLSAIPWLVTGLKILWRRVTGIGMNGGGGGTGSAYLKKQIFVPSEYLLEYIAPAISPFTVGATLTGDQTLATATIVAVDDDNGVLTITDIVGEFDGSDLQYSDDMGGLADSAGTGPRLVTLVQILDDTGVLYYESPADSNKPVAKATIVLPQSPVDGQQVLIHFGNLLVPTGIAITDLRLECNTIHALIPPQPLVIKSGAVVGNPIRAIFREIPDNRGIVGLWYTG